MNYSYIKFSLSEKLKDCGKYIERRRDVLYSLNKREVFRPHLYYKQKIMSRTCLIWINFDPFSIICSFVSIRIQIPFPSDILFQIIQFVDTQLLLADHNTYKFNIILVLFLERALNCKLIQ